MKTLLLTLVVVTIMCLDFGYTLICLTHKSAVFETTETCLPGLHKVCYKRWHIGHPGVAGCAVTCPRRYLIEIVECCATDKCNR
uniref:Three-finger toxin D.I n=1 Tax=Micrurus diastema TaxID=39023 RepID=A0A0H4BEF7_9SAUR|nr:three-finger toxin precursor D.I [Micrurus diastema]